MIYAVVVPWFIVKEMKPSFPKFTNRTSQWIVPPKIEEFTMLLEGVSIVSLKRWCVVFLSKTITEDRLCLQTDSQTYHRPQQLNAWEEQSRAQTTSLYLYFQQEVKSFCCFLASTVKVAEVAWVVQIYFTASASYSQNIQCFLFFYPPVFSVRTRRYLLECKICLIENYNH